MSTPVQLTLAVGEPAGPGLVSLAEADAIAALAARVGIAAIRIADASPAGSALDPTVVAAYLAGRHPGLGFVPELSTTHQAPYNTARRVLSLDRATGGRIGLALKAGEGDEVSDANAPDPTASDPAARWAEYALVLTRLWESFPREALIGDQAAAIVVEDSLIAAIDHAGAYYRVAGPLDGPSSVQGRPVLVADLFDVDAVAATADVVVVDHDRASDADAALTQALQGIGRSRADVALFGRVPVRLEAAALAPALAADLRAWRDERRLDGIELVPGGDADEVSTVLRELVPLLAERDTAAPSTLRAAFGLPEFEAVAA